MQLEQEKFDTLKEIADMQLNLSAASAELKNIEETTEKYLVLREEKAEKRILETLEKSREALEATTNNHKELSKYNRDLKAYANELSGLSTGITTLFQGFKKKMDATETILSEREKAADEVLKIIKVSDIQILEDRKQLTRDRETVSDGFKLLDDRRTLLQDGFNELKNKQK